MRRVFKTRHFQRWLRKKLTDSALCKAIDDMEGGLWMPISAVVW